MRRRTAAGMMSCVPSLSSKQRSTTMRCRVGRKPKRGQAGGAVGHHPLSHSSSIRRPAPSPGGSAPVVSLIGAVVRGRPAGRSPPRRARRCGPGPRPARRARSAGGHRRRAPGRCRPPPWPPATSGCPRGRCHRRWPRRRSPSDRTDGDAVGVEHDAVIAGLGDGAATGHGQPRPAGPARDR